MVTGIIPHVDQSQRLKIWSYKYISFVVSFQLVSSVWIQVYIKVNYFIFCSTWKTFKFDNQDWREINISTQVNGK